MAKSSRLRGGHGSALPGLVAEKINPDFLDKILGELPYGVAIISGTNGKTTTTKMVTELLRAAGLRVFTNPSGSNFARGVASSAIREMRRGKLNADVAILELDESHALQFAKKIAPRYALLLNVSPDQTDRFGGVEAVAKLLSGVAERATVSVVLNREDPLISKIPAQNRKFFGYSPAVARMFGGDRCASRVGAEVVLESFDKNVAKFNIGSAKLQLNGVHNAFNAAAALTLVKEMLSSSSSGLSRGPICDDMDCRNKSGNDKVAFNAQKMLAALSKIEPAYGRGETLTIDGQPLTLNMIKNPASFRLSLAGQYDPNSATMIVINNRVSDGRDVSWLNDVDFSVLKSVSVVGGMCATDMVRVLKSQNVSVGEVGTDLSTTLQNFLDQNPDRPKQIFASYTAIMEIRDMLEKKKSQN